MTVNKNLNTVFIGTPGGLHDGEEQAHSLFSALGSLGLEPGTLGLEVRASTDCAIACVQL